MLGHTALLIGSTSIITARFMWAWLREGHSIAAIWTGRDEPPRAASRNRLLSRLAPSWSVIAQAQRRGIPMRSHPRLSAWNGAEDAVAETGADTLVTCMIGDIVPPRLLDLFPGRAFNFHPALLPRYRGPNPLVGMALDGATERCAGLTLHRLDPGIDTGEIVAAKPIRYRAGDSFDAVKVRLAEAAADLTAHQLQDCLAGRLRSTPQDESKASYRRVAPEEVTITSRTSVRDAKRLIKLLGQSRRIRLDVGERTRGVDAIERIVGPPNGSAPSIRRRHATADLSDARVRFRRTPNSSAIQPQLGTLARIALSSSRRLVPW